MAVQDKYITTELTEAPPRPMNSRGSQQGGAGIRWANFTFEVAAADDDNSLFRVFKAMPPNLIPIQFWILSDGLTASTVWDIGLWNTDSGAVVVQNCLANDLDLSAAKTLTAPANGLNNVAIENLTKRLWEHAAAASLHASAYKAKGYDIGLFAATIGSAAGTISGTLLYGID